MISRLSQVPATARIEQAISYRTLPIAGLVGYREANCISISISISIYGPMTEGDDDDDNICMDPQKNVQQKVRSMPEGDDGDDDDDDDGYFVFYFTICLPT